jgi:hypothetical protein
MHKFGRGKMKDLVSLLGGRDFITRDYKEEIAEESFANLTQGIFNFINEYSFSNFVLAIKSAGFISSRLINSQMTLNFAYTLFLLLNADNDIEKTQIKHYVSKWYVLSTLTSRYITSPESAMDKDIRRIAERGFVEFYKEVEAAELSETFWTIGLVQNLETSAINSPYFNTFLAAQVHSTDNSLLMNGIKVTELITIIGDIHHIFPKDHLMNHGINDKSKYNQIANYTYLDTTTNIAIGNKPPCDYFGIAFNQCETRVNVYGNINDKEKLLVNLACNCIPENVVSMDYKHYEEFLLERRKLMADKIKGYYYSL